MSHDHNKHHIDITTTLFSPFFFTVVITCVTYVMVVLLSNENSLLLCETTISFSSLFSVMSPISICWWWGELEAEAESVSSKLDLLAGEAGKLSISERQKRRRWTGDIGWVGVVPLLDIGVTDPTRFRLMFLFAVLCQFRSATATLSLNMLAFIVEPICSFHQKVNVCLDTN